MIVVHGNCFDECGKNLALWYLNKTKQSITSAYSSIGFIDRKTGKIKGVVIFCDYTGANIEAHIYAPGCITRDNFRKVLKYVFNQLNCVRFTAKPHRNNIKVIDMVNRLGFNYETALKYYYGLTEGDDAIVYTMYRDDAKKWINLDA